MTQKTADQTTEPLTCPECGCHDLIAVSVAQGRRAGQFTRVYQSVHWSEEKWCYEFGAYRDEDAHGPDSRRVYCLDCKLELHPRRPWEPWK